MRETSELKYYSEARTKMVEGVHKLSDAVKVTLGPKGKNVAIIKPGRRPHLTKDGVTVANAVNLKDPFENLGCQVVKEAAQRSAEVAGDGTTTSTVIASALLDEGHRLLESGREARQVVEGIESALFDVVEKLEESRKKMNSREELVSVATISANGEDAVGNLIADAIEKVGADGPITVENARGFDTHLEIVEGTVIDRGFLSPYFATDKTKEQAELKKVLVLLCNQVLTSAQSILPFLEYSSSSNKSLLLVANDVSNEALQTLVVNKMKGTLSVCAIKAPEFGNARTQAMQDLADITGAKLVPSDVAVQKTDDLSEYFGYAEKVIVDKHGSLLVGTQGERDQVASKIESLKNQLESPGLQEPEINLLNRRLRRLSEGIAIIRVGGATEGEMFERRDRVDDALCAARAAKKSGVQPGGGSALVHASKKISRKKSSSETESFLAGYDALLKVCKVPMTCIVENTDEIPEIVIRKVEKSSKENFGYNAKTREYGNMLDMKIIDPHDVVVSSLTHAVSAVNNILTVGCAISISEEGGENSLGLLEDL